MLSFNWKWQPTKYDILNGFNHVTTNFLIKKIMCFCFCKNNFASQHNTFSQKKIFCKSKIVIIIYSNFKINNISFSHQFNEK